MLRFALLTFALSLLVGCGGAVSTARPGTLPAATSSTPQSLTVFAAASLTGAFQELGASFRAAHPDVAIVFNFAGTQQLAQQISQGAPVDVFASANSAFMRDMIAAGFVISGTEQIFVRNRLVVIMPGDNPAGLRSLHDLAKPGIKLDLAAKEVPVGRYSLDFLAKASQDPAFGPGYQDAVIANVVSYEENVKAVLTKVTLGEADAGIVYTSDVAALDATKVMQLAIPDALNTIATYPIAPIANAAHPALAQTFIAYVLSPAGQTILADHGFLPVNGQ